MSRGVASGVARVAKATPIHLKKKLWGKNKLFSIYNIHIAY